MACKPEQFLLQLKYLIVFMLSSGSNILRIARNLRKEWPSRYFRGLSSYVSCDESELAVFLPEGLAGEIQNDFDFLNVASDIVVQFLHEFGLFVLKENLVVILVDFQWLAEELSNVNRLSVFSLTLLTANNLVFFFLLLPVILINR